MLGSIISGIGSVVGGLFGQKSQDDQIAAQEQFAKHGIRWRVNDAKKAGIHPLYALGANTHSFSPIGVGGGIGEGIANAASNIGAGLDRAMLSKGTQLERDYNAKIMQLSLQRGELENQLLASQIARVNTPTQRQPAMPVVGPSIAERFGINVPGSGDADRVVMPIPERFGGTVGGNGSSVVNVPLERIMDQSAPFREPGAVSEGSWVRTPTGMAPAPSYDFNERVEDVFGPDLAWSWRNMVLPNIIDDPRVKPPAPDGYRWMWSVARQEYQLVKN